MKRRLASVRRTPKIKNTFNFVSSVSDVEPPTPIDQEDENKTYVLDFMQDLVKPPMLAQAYKTLKQFELLDCTQYLLEEKYDGERLLISIKGLQVTFFSRTMNKINCMVPRRAFHLNERFATSCIVDGERVYTDPETGSIVRFCNTGQRHHYNEVIYVFDIQELNGASVMHETLLKRKSLLSTCLIYNDSVKCAIYDQVSSYSMLMDKFNDVVKNNNGEGLMLKLLHSPYIPFNRAFWIKMKKLHIIELKEEYDLYAYKFIPDKNGIFNIVDCGLYDENDVYHHIVNVSSGMDKSKRSKLYAYLASNGKNEFPHKAVVVSVTGDCVTERNKSIRHPTLVKVTYYNDCDPLPLINDSEFAI